MPQYTTRNYYTANGKIIDEVWHNFTAGSWKAAQKEADNIGKEYVKEMATSPWPPDGHIVVMCERTKVIDNMDRNALMKYSRGILQKVYPKNVTKEPPPKTVDTSVFTNEELLEVNATSLDERLQPTKATVWTGFDKSGGWGVY